MDCIFCKIGNGEIPSQKIYENEDFLVFLDIFPATKGHCLVVPKAHYANIFEMPLPLVESAFGLAKRVMNLLSTALGVKDWNILQNNGALAGQSVFHFHIHLIPRYENDQALGFWKPMDTAGLNLDELRSKLAHYLENVD